MFSQAAARAALRAHQHLAAQQAAQQPRGASGADGVQGRRAVGLTPKGVPRVPIRASAPGSACMRPPWSRPELPELRPPPAGRFISAAAFQARGMALGCSQRCPAVPRAAGPGSECPPRKMPRTGPGAQGPGPANPGVTFSKSSCLHRRSFCSLWGVGEVVRTGLACLQRVVGPRPLDSLDHLRPHLTDIVAERAGVRHGWLVTWIFY